MGRGTVVLVAVLCVVACAPQDERALADTEQAVRDTIVARLAAYASAARAVDADGSAEFFAPGGTLFEPGIPPIVSPDSIRAFIASFPGVIVDSAMLRADTVEVFSNMALVWGTYFEALRFAGQAPSAQHGRFVMRWVRDSSRTWRIDRYYRVPLPAHWVDRP